MKKKLCIAISIASLFTINAIHAQDCNSFYPVRQGVITEMTNYDGSNQVTGIVKNTIMSNETTADGYRVTVKSETFDTKNVSSGSVEYSYSCTGGKFLLNMKSYFDPRSMSAFKDMDVKIDAGDLDMPSVPAVGQILNEGALSLHISTNGIPLMSIKIRLYNRKVAAMESITTPAGTFDCFKITYDMETSGVVSVNSKSSEWYAKETGTVKTQNFDANGKLLGSSMLTKISQ